MMIINNTVMRKTKFCEACKSEVLYNGWSVHLKSRKHKKNDPDQTIKPGKPGRFSLTGRLSLMRPPKSLRKMWSKNHIRKLGYTSEDQKASFK
jgi:hypothetical protein